MVIGVVEDLFEVHLLLVIELLDLGLLTVEIPFVGGVFGEGGDSDQEQNCEKD